ncbi:hypothetical protein EYF80_021786 [Liparis tanakae]|uniref:Uncharacterized protein n=1 Tax=Liparis tanakae TaxID=230148 RepID=A0A4Z2HSL0_9TELE|nr:hypothetical protein EYF80_021786 [Liparis tanakae]
MPITTDIVDSRHCTQAGAVRENVSLTSNGRDSQNASAFALEDYGQTLLPHNNLTHLARFSSTCSQTDLLLTSVFNPLARLPVVSARSSRGIAHSHSLLTHRIREKS